MIRQNDTKIRLNRFSTFLTTVFFFSFMKTGEHDEVELHPNVFPIECLDLALNWAVKDIHNVIIRNIFFFFLLHLTVIYCNVVQKRKKKNRENIFYNFTVVCSNKVYLFPINISLLFIQGLKKWNCEQQRLRLPSMDFPSTLSHSQILSRCCFQFETLHFRW